MSSFLVYAQQSIAYRILVVKSNVPNMHVDTIMESRDATFFENMFPMKYMHSTSRFSSEIIPEPIKPIESAEQPHEDVIEDDDSEVVTPSNFKANQKSLKFKTFDFKTTKTWLSPFESKVAFRK